MFWKDKPLQALSHEEWEALCDGCGRCCLQKLQDIDSGQTWFTRIACRLLDINTCRCTDYPNRLQKVADCTSVRPITEQKCQWLPNSCAYRQLQQHGDLPAWHPLQNGNSGQPLPVSIRDWAISEQEVRLEDYENYLIEFDQDDEVVL